MKPSAQPKPLDLARALCAKGADLALHYWHRHLDFKIKDDNSPVTRADQKIEAMMRDALIKHFPDDGLLGEEEGPWHIEREALWVMDPIDGTRAFIAGCPLFGVMLGRLRDGKADLGAVAMPALGDLFYAKRGEGAFNCSGRLRVNQGERRSRPRLVINGVERMEKDHPSALRRLRDLPFCVREGHDCYSHLLVAAGLVDLVVDNDLQAYDVLPFAPIIAEAGGFVVDGAGQDVTLRFEGTVVTAGEAALRDQALNALA